MPADAQRKKGAPEVAQRALAEMARHPMKMDLLLRRGAMMLELTHARIGAIDLSARPIAAINFVCKRYFGTPCFHLSQWATTSLMNGAEAAHRLLMAGTKPPELPSGPQPQSECQADSPG